MSMRPGTSVRSGRSMTSSASDDAVRIVGHRGDAVALDDDARALEHLTEVDVEDALARRTVTVGSGMSSSFLDRRAVWGRGL